MVSKGDGVTAHALGTVQRGRAGQDAACCPRQGTEGRGTGGWRAAHWDKRFMGGSTREVRGGGGRKLEVGN